MKNKLNMKTKDISKENINKIKKLFPNVVTEYEKNGKIELGIDFDLLKQELSDELIDERKERFQMTWPGKMQSILVSNTKTNKTLRPNKEKSVNFDNTGNLYIEGDNLEVLKLLRETYLNKVDVIYIDPPYNTGNDFIYNDKFKKDRKEYKESTDIFDEDENRMYKNVDSNGRFHSDWLSMMYPRLKIARDLLCEEGVIFISIDDNEFSNLKKVCDEIFGSDNFVANINWQSSFGGKNDTKLIPINTEYILCYSRAQSFEKNITKQLVNYKYKDENYEKYGMFNIQPLCRSSLTWYKNLDFIIYVKKINNELSISFEEDEFTIGKIVAGPSKLSINEKLKLRDERFSGKNSENDWCFYWSKEVIISAFKDNFIFITEENGQFNIYQKNYEFAKYSGRSKKIEYVDNSKIALRNVISDSKITSKTGNDEINLIFDKKIFDYPKPSSLIKKLLSVKNKNALVLDFFSGSATTAQAILDLNREDGGNRKYIMVQFPEEIENNPQFKNICEIGEERIRRVDKENIGFRVLELDSSNLKKEVYQNEKISQLSLIDLESNIKEDRNYLDLLFQVMLELGLELSSKIKEEKFNDQLYYIINENDLIACFVDGISEILIKNIANNKPSFVIFKDSSFASDSEYINMEQIFKSISPNTKIKVL
ncbi:MAG: site-specific DNA-methyltransferase [Metamycoplasmataceae bacterium]